MTAITVGYSCGYPYTNVSIIDSFNSTTLIETSSNDLYGESKKSQIERDSC